MAEPRVYELVFIVDPDLDEDSVTKLSENLQQIVTDQGGTIVKAESMGRRKLAYPINRRTEGHYMLFEIEGTGKEIAELERRMRVNDQIVRYITVRVDEDRKRAEKMRARRASKASKAPANRPRTASVAGADGEDGGDEEVVRAAPNRQQGNNNNRRFRRRKVSRLLIDKVDILDFKDAEMLGIYLPERGKILPRRISGMTAMHQRMLAEAIKRARNIALLPYVTD